MKSKLLTATLVAIAVETSAFAADRGLLSPGETRSAQIQGPSSLDTWQFYGSAGDRVLISAITTSGDLDTWMVLYPPDGGAEEVDGWPWGDSIDHQLLQSGLYTLVVQDGDLTRTGEYDVSLTMIPGTLRPGVYNLRPSGSVSAEYGTVDLAWDPVADATGYDVFVRSDFGNAFTLAGSTLSPSFTLPVVFGARYDWFVRVHRPQGSIDSPHVWIEIASDPGLVLVALDAQCGAVSPSSISGSPGQQVILPAATRGGYAFGGWWTGPGGSGALASSPYTVPAGNVTLYAQWTPMTSRPITLPPVTAGVNTDVDIPVLIDDAGGVLGFSVTLNYPAALADYVTVLPGSLTAGWSIVPNGGTDGRVVIAGAGASALAGSGSLCIVRLHTAAATGSGSLSLDPVELNDGAVAAAGSSGVDWVPPAGGWDTGYQEIGGGWRRLAWFGDYVPMGGEGWIWHNRHGFFFIPADATPDGCWLFAQDMGWLWTSRSVYPFLYRQNGGAWLWFNGSTNPRWFVNMATGQWEAWW